MALSSRKNGLSHLNGHMICTIDVETSGPTPGYHDIIQVCALPLDYALKPWFEKKPFYTEIQPKRPENYDHNMRAKHRISVAKAQINGIEAYRCAEMFDAWFENLKLGPGRRLVPLAHNWPFDREFMIDWLGRENFNYMFDVRYRDTMVCAEYLNDYTDFQIETVPYSKVDLRWLCRQHGITNEFAHDALSDCVATAEIYRQMVWKGLSGISPVGAVVATDEEE